jgi:hypothetical protein
MSDEKKANVDLDKVNRPSRLLVQQLCTSWHPVPNCDAGNNNEGYSCSLSLPGLM